MRVIAIVGLVMTVTGCTAYLPETNQSTEFLYYKQQPVAAPAPEGERYLEWAEQDMVAVAQKPVSAFSANVDTASYLNARRFLNAGQFPPPESVRVEEFVYFFQYDYSMPERAGDFSVTTDVMESPWHQDRVVMRIGLQASEAPQETRLPAHYVLLVDTSGSMSEEMPLVKRGLHMLLDSMQDEDRMTLFTYANSVKQHFKLRTVSDRKDIKQAINTLVADGGTNGAIGLKAAFDFASLYATRDSSNRVILMSDGDFNQGETALQRLKNLVDRYHGEEIGFTSIGFGEGNLNDALIGELSRAGSGQHGYVRDGHDLARYFGNARLVAPFIARDMKIQVEFNPKTVAAWRLVGYDDSRLTANDVSNPDKKATHIGASWQITALYELELEPSSNAQADTGLVNQLRYEGNQVTLQPEKGVSTRQEFAALSLVYQKPGDRQLRRQTTVVPAHIVEMDAADRNTRQAVVAASFALMLKQSEHQGGIYWDKLISILNMDEASSNDQVQELRRLVMAARFLDHGY